MSNNVLICFDNILKIQDVGFHSINKLYTHPSRKLDLEVFLYVAEGQMEVWEEEREYRVKKGQFLFLKSGLHHWGEPKTPAGTSWYWVHFYSNTPTENCQELNFHLNSCKLLSISPEEYSRFIKLPKQGNISHPQKLEKKLDLMIESYKATDPFRAINLSLHTMELFISVFRESMDRGSLTKSDHTVNRILEYLEHKESYGLNSKELEASLNMNYSYLCEVFKNKTGSTIHMYNSQIFISKAIEMMKSSNLNISEISDMLGFKNPFYFSRVFRKILGCAPSEYMGRIYKE